MFTLINQILYNGLMKTLLSWFLYFVIYSIIGWIFETIYVSLRLKKFTPRGFLFGPYCPIYGIGAVLSAAICIALDLHWYGGFIAILIASSLLELFASYILEKIFKVRWWDYERYKFNLNGRIALIPSLGLAIVGTIAIYGLMAFLMMMTEGMSILSLLVIDIIAAVIMLTDFIVTIFPLVKVKNIFDRDNVDRTAEIRKYKVKYYKKPQRKKRKEARKAKRKN